jgi:hypothetical protein
LRREAACALWNFDRLPFGKLAFVVRRSATLPLQFATAPAWNRLNIAFRTPAGTYQVGQFEKLKKTA